VSVPVPDGAPPGAAGGLVAARSQIRSRRRRVVRILLVWAGLIPFLVIVLFPVTWMTITAFKDEADLYRMGQVPFFFNLPPSLKHFRLLFTQTWFGAWAVNTALVAAWVVAITLALAVPAAYALARLRMPAATGTGIAIFMTYLVPPIILFLPLTRVVAALGVWDSWWALVLVYPTFTIPFCTWLMMGFFRSVPLEIEEAAWVDGCGRIGGIFRVVLPLSMPGIVTTGFIACTLSMHEYLYAVVYSSPMDQKVISVGLPTMLIRGDIFFWGALMAGALLIGLPMALLGALFIDRFVAGLSAVPGR